LFKDYLLGIYFLCDPWTGAIPSPTKKVGGSSLRLVLFPPPVRVIRLNNLVSVCPLWSVGGGPPFCFSVSVKAPCFWNSLPKNSYPTNTSFFPFTGQSFSSPPPDSCLPEERYLFVTTFFSRRGKNISLFLTLLWVLVLRTMSRVVFLRRPTLFQASRQCSPC